MEPDKLFTTTEAAQELSMSASMIRYLVSTGTAKPLRKAGKGWLFTAEEIERIRTRPRQQKKAK